VELASIVHVAEHPSKATRFPSSQASAPVFKPFPQTEQTEGAVPVHVELASTVQVAEHPSPATRLPSSHTSALVASTSPFPQ
jgi:hypothetical protein